MLVAGGERHVASFKATCMLFSACFPACTGGRQAAVGLGLQQRGARDCRCVPRQASSAHVLFKSLGNTVFGSCFASPRVTQCSSTQHPQRSRSHRFWARFHQIERESQVGSYGAAPPPHGFSFEGVPGLPLTFIVDRHFRAWPDAAVATQAALFKSVKARDKHRNWLIIRASRPRNTKKGPCIAAQVRLH